VEDNGIGFEQEDAEKIFGLFKNIQEPASDLPSAKKLRIITRVLSGLKVFLTRGWPFMFISR